jgi:hypothetical protein
MIFWVIPKNWDFKYLKNWWKKNKGEILQPSDVQVVSLLEKVQYRVVAKSIAEIVDKAEFTLNKPRSVD